ncbi:ABC transporter substrate-binding protein [Pseudarthrobacter sp. Y6]|uniref:ABC transporter substrate-binding protein n=1 Tax=Pseudarthrobacter sp. Y6 TaxID=3418422 RepID=UPI003CE944A5
MTFDMDEGQPGSVDNFSPYGPNQTNGLVQAVYEPLFITNVKTGELEPWLANSATANASFDVWTLVLKKGIKWSDGKDYTADDVVYTFNLLTSGTGLQTSVPLAKGVTATAKDALTVEFTLPKADPQFAGNLFGTGLASKAFTVLPKHIWEAQADVATFTNFDIAKGYPVGTGPYKLTGTSPNTFSYERRDDWWGVSGGLGQLPAPKTLTWSYLGTESTRASALQSGALDAAAQFSLGTFQTIKAQNPGIQAWDDKTPFGQSDVCGYSLDINASKAPWDDAKFRWAINDSLDRNKLINVAFQGASKPMDTPFPDLDAVQKFASKLPAATQKLKEDLVTPDAAKAQKVFETAGYAKNQDGIYAQGGQTLKLEVSNFDSPPKNALAAAVVEQLRQAGIDAVQAKKTVPNFIADEQAGNFQANLFFGSCGSLTNPWLSMDAFNVSHLPADGGKIAGFYSNPFRWGTTAAANYSALVDEMKTTPSTDAKYQELVSKALQIWYEELPMIPLAYNYQLNPVSTANWKGWPSAQDSYAWGLYTTPSVNKVLQHLKPAS